MTNAFGHLSQVDFNKRSASAAMRCSREDLSEARELFEAHAVETFVSELLCTSTAFQQAVRRTLLPCTTAPPSSRAERRPAVGGHAVRRERRQTSTQALRAPRLAASTEVPVAHARLAEEQARGDCRLRRGAARRSLREAQHPALEPARVAAPSGSHALEGSRAREGLHAAAGSHSREGS
jgi:hypothetical protein